MEQWSSGARAAAAGAAAAVQAGQHRWQVQRASRGVGGGDAWADARSLVEVRDKAQTAAGDAPPRSTDSNRVDARSGGHELGQAQTGAGAVGQARGQGGGMLECGSQGRRELARRVKPGNSVVQEAAGLGPCAGRLNTKGDGQSARALEGLARHVLLQHGRAGQRAVRTSWLAAVSRPGAGWRSFWELAGCWLGAECWC